MKTVLFKQGTLTFPDTSHREATATVAAFAIPAEGRDLTIYDATVFVRGYDVTFLNGDHNLLQAKVGLDVVISDDRKWLSVDGRLLLRDSNGDDPYRGSIDYSLVVVLEQESFVIVTQANDQTGMLKKLIDSQL